MANRTTKPLATSSILKFSRNSYCGAVSNIKTRDNKEYNYTGSRQRHNFELVNFWKPEAIEELRRVKLIYEPGLVTGLPSG
jgi:hypothetical protein